MKFFKKKNVTVKGLETKNINVKDELSEHDLEQVMSRPKSENQQIFERKLEKELKQKYKV